jgi:hypothetical protein
VSAPTFHGTHTQHPALGCRLPLVHIQLLSDAGVQSIISSIAPPADRQRFTGEQAMDLDVPEKSPTTATNHPFRQHNYDQLQ